MKFLPMNNESQIQAYKVILLGDSGVGKTPLLLKNAMISLLRGQ
jgi:GTPase SAR1 family protein